MSTPPAPPVGAIVVAASAVAAAGDIATVSILRPDGVTDSVLVTLDASGAGSGSYTITMDGTFSYSATVPADAQYSAATSATGSFTESSILLPRTITVTITPSA